MTCDSRILATPQSNEPVIAIMGDDDSMDDRVTKKSRNII
jgi:hypothetical protein